MVEKQVQVKKKNTYFTWAACNIILFQKMWTVPGKAFPTHRTHIGLVDSPVMRANMVGHSVLPFKALLADGALKWLFIWMGELVAIQMVYITKGLATHLTPMVFLDRLGGFLGDILLWYIAHCRWCHDTWGNGGGCGGEDACYCGNVGRVAVVVSWHGRNHGNHCGGCLRSLLWPWHHLDTGVAGLMPSQVVAVTEGLVAVATDERCFAFVFLLYHRHWWPCASSTGHIVFEEIQSAGRGLLVYLDRKDRLLVNLFSSCIKKWQQAVLGHLVLVVEGFIGLLMKQTNIHTEINIWLRREEFQTCKHWLTD